MKRSGIKVFFGILAIVTVSAFAVTLTIDENVEFQTMEGFGAHGAMEVWWGDPPFYNQAFLDNVIDDLGLTMIRNEYYPDTDQNAFTGLSVPMLFEYSWMTVVMMT